MSRAILMTVLLVATMANNPWPAAAATFAVTSKIFAGNSPQAAAQHRILFDHGLVYDLPQTDPQTITVYDPAQGLVTLLHQPTQQQTSIRTEDLVQITAQARAAAAKPHQQQQLGLLAKVVASDRVSGYAIKFGNAEYHVVPQKPEDPQFAIDFGRFSDLASRLNLVRRLGLPPFARMTMSDHLAAAGEIPSQTTLTLRRDDRIEEFRSTVAVDQLSAADRARIQEVRGMMTLYRDIPPGDFPDP